MSALSLRPLLLEDHRRIEALMEEVREGSRANVDARTLNGLWSRFARALEAHLEMEERELFPLIDPRHDEEVAELSREHIWFRQELDHLSVAEELHMVRDRAIQRFLDRLRAHAEREDQRFYAWLDEELPIAKRRSLVRAHEELPMDTNTTEPGAP